MISMADFLQGRDVKYPLTPDLKFNASQMIHKLELLEGYWGYPLILTSGYRPEAINDAVFGARRGSWHTKCAAVDLHDAGGLLSKWLLDHLYVLEETGLWMESPDSAKNHLHLQMYPPRSGSRVFVA